MKKIVLKIAIAVGMLTLIGGVLVAQTGNDLFQQALVKERTEGNLQEAIRLYQTIVQKYGSDRRLVARALFQIGQAYEKLGNTDARKAYERIVREFADQKEVAAEARTRLGSLPDTRLADALTARVLWSGNGVDFTGSILPDGRLMVIDWASSGDIAIRDMTTGEIKRLMAKAGSWEDSRVNAQFPLPSPDLRQIAYNWTERPGDHIGDGRVNQKWELRVMANETGGKHRVLLGSTEFQWFEPSAWSRDSKSILVNLWKRDGTKQIAWVSVSDGTIRLLRSLDWRLLDGRSSLSPDGRYIAYAAWDSADSRKSAIYVVAADGSSENALMKPVATNQFPVWAPDGKHVVYVSNRSGNLDLWSIAVQDGKPAGEPVLAKSDIGKNRPIGFTRSGSYYYGHADGGADIYAADIDPTTGKIGERSVLTETFAGSNRHPRLSRDQKFIAYQSQRERGDNYSPEIVVRSIETGQERSYPPNPMRLGGQVMWFRDGNSILHALRDTQNRVSFYRLDLKTGEFTQTFATDATSGSVESALSLDERTVYTNVGGGNRFGSPNVFAYDLATGQKRVVFTAVPGALVSGLALSPNGRTLALKLVYPKAERHLILVDIDGKNIRDLHTDTADFDSVRPQLAWTKDGQTIYFTRSSKGDDWQLMRISAEGGKPEFTGLAGTGTPGIDLYANDSRIAFDDGIQGVSELWTLDNLPILKSAR